MLGLFMLLAGCTSSGRDAEITRALGDYYNGNYKSAIQILEPYAAKTDENYVLNNLRLASVALVDYDLPRAESAFYKAYEVINSGGVNDAGRATAAAVVHEKFKIWKGEPFERAMANFYLGLVYYMRQDYANARAAFENALFKLRDYGEEKDKDDEYREVESDFAIAYIMLGKCWQKLGDEDKARFDLKRAGDLRPALRGAANYALNETDNVLLVVDFGLGPEKVTEYDNSIVTFAPKPAQMGPIPPPRVHVDGNLLGLRAIGAAPMDLLELAQERRWQSIDTIRLGKSIVGTGLMAGGAYELAHSTGAHSSRTQNRELLTGAALMGAGALLKASSGADLRYWETLPRTTFLLPLKLTPGKHELTVSFGDRGGISQTWRGIVAPAKGEATYYMKVSRTTTGPFRWPPPNLAETRDGERVSGVE